VAVEQPRHTVSDITVSHSLCYTPRISETLLVTNFIVPAAAALHSAFCTPHSAVLLLQGSYGAQCQLQLQCYPASLLLLACQVPAAAGWCAALLGRPAAAVMLHQPMAADQAVLCKSERESRTHPQRQRLWQTSNLSGNQGQVQRWTNAASSI
jgi:hypothetical protein